MTTQIQDLPLKDMDQHDLAAAIMEAIGGFDRRPLIIDAMSSAAWLHRNQDRANRGSLPRTPYIEHPLRNTLRLIRWGVTDADLLIAALLHDCVEDCSEEIIEIFLGKTPYGTAGQRQDQALKWVQSNYGYRASRLVRAVTMPPFPEGATKPEKNELYARNIAHHISGDAAVFLLKFADYVDNALGLHHNNVDPNKAMVAKLAAKYLPVSDLFVRELEFNPAIRDLISDDGFTEISRQVHAARGRLESLLGI